MVRPPLQESRCGLCLLKNTLCSPGRFFAALELRVMLACIVLRYDVKFREEGRRPENEWLATTCYPCRTAKVLFRRRDVLAGGNTV